MLKKIEKLRMKFARFRRVRWPRRIRKLKIMSRHPFAVPVITLGGLIVLTLGIYFLARQTNHLPVTADAKIVIISHDHVQQIVPSKEPTVGALLAKLHINLGQGDRVEPAVATAINQEDFRINIYRAVPVEIVADGKQSLTFSAGTTPRAIATQAGVRVYPEDEVEADPTQNFIGGGSIGERIVVDRATPINLNLYGTQIVVRTHAPTVANLIRQKHIKLAKSDEVTPAASTPITPGMQVYIERQGVKIEAVTETIPMPIQAIQDDSLAFGTSAIRQQGSPGQQIVTYQDQLVNGVVVGRTVLQKVITQQPVTQIEVIGTSLSGIKADMALAGISPGDYNYVDYIVSHESGWCPTKAQGQYGSCPPYAGYVPPYGGYGLCQSTPGSKMASAGSDWATNPITQLRWCNGYALGRYGSWYAAYEHWLAYHNW
ncbi:MAG TPA: ubiquitin-like domain-containing protein [Candidatus Saccharimonadales bacterium]|nr:ubiquitin-like domain-containing protein [Candidatus Saccharimonadales bacterium]